MTPPFAEGSANYRIGDLNVEMRQLLDQIKAARAHETRLGYILTLAPDAISR